MNFLDKVKRWPMKKKRIFSISLAVFLTVLIIVLNSAINLIWKDEMINKTTNKNNPIKLIQESFSKIFNVAKPALDQVFGSSTGDKIIDQTNSASSSFSTTSNVVE
jgi:predicted PurR-regulated permease PerM